MSRKKIITSRETALKQALSELRYAIIATGITLAVAIALYLFIPQIRTYLGGESAIPLTARLYRYLPQGGEMEYRPLQTSLEPSSSLKTAQAAQQAADSSDKASRSVSDGEAEPLSESLSQQYRHDLERLVRRFERGQFEMVSLPGMKNLELYKTVRRFSRSYSYKIEKSQEGVVLKVTADDQAAVEALHAYLRYLEENWS